MPNDFVAKCSFDDVENHFATETLIIIHHRMPFYLSFNQCGVTCV